MSSLSRFLPSSTSYRFLNHITTAIERLFDEKGSQRMTDHKKAAAYTLRLASELRTLLLYVGKSVKKFENLDQNDQKIKNSRES